MHLHLLRPRDLYLLLGILVLSRLSQRAKLASIPQVLVRYAISLIPRSFTFTFFQHACIIDKDRTLSSFIHLFSVLRQMRLARISHGV